MGIKCDVGSNFWREARLCWDSQEHFRGTLFGKLDLCGTTEDARMERETGPNLVYDAETGDEFY